MTINKDHEQLDQIRESNVSVSAPTTDRVDETSLANKMDEIEDMIKEKH